MLSTGLRFVSILGISSLLASPLWAGPLRDWIQERQYSEQRLQPLQSDVPYGAHPNQHFDVYRAPHPLTNTPAPVIFLVHGGAWRWGDKSSSDVVTHKLQRWLPLGFVVISVDYPMLPETPPLEQAKSIGRAINTAQSQAERWGADRTRFILMGHSAGGHLLALLNANKTLSPPQTTPWLGTIALDSAAFDIPSIMQSPHLPLYDYAFGNNPQNWQTVSPLHQLKQTAPPLLAVCSTRRADACSQAQAFAEKAKSLGMNCRVLPQNRSHLEINQQLGEDSTYTAEVEGFMKQLDPLVARLLSSKH